MRNHAILKPRTLVLRSTTLRTLAAPALGAAQAPAVTVACTEVGHSTCVLGCTTSAAG